MVCSLNCRPAYRDRKEARAIHSKPKCFKELKIFISRSTTIARQAHHVNMSSASKTTSNYRQAMATQPRVQKALQAPARNRQMTITPTKALWPKPLLVTTPKMEAARGQYKAPLPTSCNCVVKAPTIYCGIHRQPPARASHITHAAYHDLLNASNPPQSAILHAPPGKASVRLSKLIVL